MATAYAKAASDAGEKSVAKRMLLNAISVRGSKFVMLLLTLIPATNLRQGQRLHAVGLSTGSYTPPITPEQAMSAEVRLEHILLQHPLGGEEGSIQGNGVAHHLKKAVEVAIKKREDHGFQLVIQRSGVPTAAPDVMPGTISDRPASDSFNVSLDPPPIQHAQAGNAIERSLHPARPRCFERWLRSVEPEVHPRHEDLGEIHVVVFQIRDFNLILQRLLEVEDSFDQFLAGLVMRMSLAGIDQLKTPGFGSNGAQAFRICEKEICALVGSNTAGKSDCQHGWIECDVGCIV